MASSIGMRADGHMYYVIGGSSGKKEVTAETFTVVNTIAERDQIGRGMVMVRNPALDDETVNSGWGLYIFDEISSKWIKIAEEESVEGGDIDIDALLQGYTTIEDFNTHVENSTVKFNDIERALQKKVPFTRDAYGRIVISSDVVFKGNLSWAGSAGFISLEDVDAGHTPGTNSSDCNYNIRNGWYINYVDDTNIDYASKVGTVDVYVSKNQQRFEQLIKNTIESVYDAEFETGFVPGRMVYIRNGSNFADCAEIIAVQGNKITLGNFVTMFYNKPGTNYIKTWRDNPDAEETYYIRKYVKAGTDGHLTAFANTTYYEMVDDKPVVVDKSLGVNADKVYYTINGYEISENSGHPAEFKEGWEYFIVSDISYKYSTSYLTASKIKGQPDEYGISMTRPANSAFAGGRSVINAGEAMTTDGGAFSSGWGCAALGYYSSVMGVSNVAHGKYSVTIGAGLYNPIYMGTVTGVYNEIPEMTEVTPYVFAVGIGKNESSRADGLRVYRDGRVWVNQVSKLRQLDTAAASTTMLASRLNKVMAALGAETLSQITPKFNVPGTLAFYHLETGVMDDGTEIMIAPSKSNAGLFYTLDGVNYYQTNVKTGNFERAVYDAINKQFVVGGSSGIWHSSDGKNWIQSTTTPAGQITSKILTDGSQAFICGHQISTDGVEWTEGENTDGGNAGAIIETAEHGVVFVAWKSGHGLDYSTDGGETWNPYVVAEGINGDVNLDNVGYGTDKNGKPFVIASPISPNETATVIFSYDGINWDSCGLQFKQGFENPIVYPGGVVVVCTMSTKESGCGIYYAAAFNGKSTTWTWVPNIMSGAYYAPREITIGGKTYKISMPYKYADYMVASRDGKTWVKTRLSINAQCPTIFKGIVGFPMQDAPKGIRTYSEEEFSEILESAFAAASRSTYIKHIGDDWDEDVLTSKLNEIIDVINNLM